MAIQSNEEQSSNVNFVFPPFKARGLVLTRDVDGEWEEEEVTYENIEGLRDLLSPHDDSITQVNISRYVKLLYSIDFMTDKMNTEAKIRDMNGDQHFLVSPLVIIECGNNDLPMDITETCKDKVMSMLVRF